MKLISGKALALMGALLLGVTLMTGANAQYAVLVDLAAFSGDEALIDFQGAGEIQGDSVGAVDGVSFALSPSGIAPRFSNQDTSPRQFDPQGVEAIDAAGSGAPFNPYNDLGIVFPGPVNRVGFEISANPFNSIDVTALNAGVVIAQISFSTDMNGGFTFIGFETDDPIDEVFIEIGNSLGSGFWRFDNLRYELSDTDADGDGVHDNDDLCPGTPPGEPVNVDGCTDTQAIEGVGDDIQALSDDPGTTNSVRDKLAKAQDKLADALEKFAQGDVKKGIEKIADAVKELLNAQKEGGEVTDFIDQLVELALGQAQDVIDAAQGCDDGLDPDQQADCLNEIGKANEEMVKAEAELAKGHPHHAIDHYAKAWDHASKALP